MNQGIDISNYQKGINWDEIKANNNFVIIKASQGHAINSDYGFFEDSMFKTHMENAISRDLDIGVYHYLTACNVTEAVTEAQAFINVINPYKKYITVFAAVDVEEDKYLPTNKVLLTNIVKVFCEEVGKTGLIPAFYTNPSYLQNRMNNLTDIPLWLALWRDKSNVPTQYSNMVMWQYGTTTVGTMEVDGNLGFYRSQKTTSTTKANSTTSNQDNTPADWAKEAVNWATSSGLMYGDENGNLMLHANVTREQLVVFLHRLYKMLR